jgi:hypothetical protein
MVSAADNEDAVVALQPVDFVEEVAPHRVRHERVEILKDEVAGRELPCFEEDLADAIFGAGELALSVTTHFSYHY